MNTTPARVPRNALREVQNSLAEMRSSLQASLPTSVPVDRFVRTVLTAVQVSPELLEADRRSLFVACLQAAHDGLLPDGREGAFVIFNTKVKRGGQEQWVEKVQWMPMYGGLLKKIRGSKQLASIAANVVHEGDEFSYQLGDDEQIVHKPVLSNRGKPIAAYAIAWLKDGSIYREVLGWDEIERIRSVSRSSEKKESSPWKKWPDEMARKSVIRRLAKRLPMSTDLDTYLDTASPVQQAMTPPIVPANAQLPDPESLERSVHGMTCAALEAINDANDADEVQRAWLDTVEAFGVLGMGVPIDIEAARNERLEALAGQERPV